MEIFTVNFPKLEIESLKDTNFSVKINGVEYDTIRNIDVDMGVGKIPLVKLEMYASVDIKTKERVIEIKSQPLVKTLETEIIQGSGTECKGIFGDIEELAKWKGQNCD